MLTPNNFQTAVPSLSSPYTHNLSTTQKVETKRHCAIELHKNCLKQIIDMEVSMGINKRWDPSTPEYVETLGYLSTRTYQCALEELQRLVIQCLFELHKMNILATGEYSQYSIPDDDPQPPSLSYAYAYHKSITEPLQGNLECSEDLQCHRLS